MNKFRLGIALSLFCGVIFNCAALEANADSNDGVQHVNEKDLLPPGFSSWDELNMRQNVLNRAASTIERVSKGEEGFSGIEILPARNTLSLYWHGKLPSAVREEVINKNPLPVHISVVSADYSRGQIQQAISEIEKMLPLKREPLVTRIAPMEDGSGVRVWTEAPVGKLAETEYLKEFKVPVFLSHGDRLENTASPASRDTDISPYWGGARYYGNGSCSTGFAAVDHNTKYPVMLTAAHCVEVGAKVMVGDSYPLKLNPDGTLNWHQVGKAYVKSPTHDSAAIDMPSSPSIYRGSVGSSARGLVAGQVKAYKGSYVCAGGASSGENCGLLVSATGATAIDKEGKPYEYNLSIAASAPGGLAVAGGDSGGPVFYPLARSTSVKAAGIISGGLRSVSCSGVESPAPPQDCYNELAFVPLQDVLDVTLTDLSIAP
ncbi:S1 family peptidase [Streptomyces sp. NPDC086783]|uniref:S1 family peptidase n=1 Tax=Streptomyces sp. NPDC086783 TaxID=3365758 RepID=UPI00382AD5A4